MVSPRTRNVNQKSGRSRPAARVELPKRPLAAQTASTDSLLGSADANGHGAVKDLTQQDDLANAVDEVCYVGDTPRVAPPSRPADEFVGSAYQPKPNESRRGIFVPDWVLSVVDDCVERLVLAQLAYLSGIGKGGKLRTWVFLDRYHWVRITYRKLGSQVGLRKRSARHAVSKLRRRGLLVTRDDTARGHLLHLRIDALAVANALNTRPAKEDVDDDNLL